MKRRRESGASITGRAARGTAVAATAFAMLGLVAAGALAAERAIPFWPDEVPAAIHAEIDGNATLETVRELARFHRVHGSPGFAAAAEHMKKKLLAAGLADAVIEKFPADGKTKYAHFLSYYGWNPVSATLEEVSPRPGLVESFPELPVALADYSQDADVTAELVDVGGGTDPKDYAGKEVAGKIVLADGSLPAVHRLACEERGAAGFLSAFPNQTTAWSGDDRDLVRWGHLSPYQLRNRFAFMLSKRQAADYRARIAAGEKIVVRVRVAAKMVPATFDVVVATIPGSDGAAGEVVLTAHLCHESSGANDNASGSAAIFEVARSLQTAIRKQKLARPRRTIRFLWLPEIAGSQAYLIRHPEVAERGVGGIHMDMVGGLLATTKGTLHISRTAESRPHVVNEIAAAWLDSVLAASGRYAEQGGDPRAGYVWLPGSREPLLADLRPLELGSDHEVFEEASFGVPMVYFHDWPDVTIHTNKDLPENLDATKLGRVAYMGAGIAWTLAALPDSEALRLFQYARARGEARIALARGEEDRDGLLTVAEAIDVARDTLASMARLWPSTASAARGEEDRLRELARVVRPPAAAGSDARVPVRNREIRGPLDVYYFDYLSSALGSEGRAVSGEGGTSTALTRRPRGGLLAYETLNLVDGRRSVSAIRDVLSGRYDSVPTPEVAEYLELLARAKVIAWKESPSPPASK
jgi:aminopeptidase YwaD